MFEKILIATDGSEHSERAAKMAVEMAKLSGGTVTALYVADTSRTSHLPDDMLLYSIRGLLMNEGKEAISFIEKLASDSGVGFESAIVEGNPGEEIIGFAEKSGMSMIVMGSVGRTGLDKFLLGSVAEKVVRNSKVPVLTVPRESS
ncbi:MAG: universal stress protein [Methanotrichaceae archaeon]|nr:universal stress protein [Methanotrichaceae archaeon]